MKLQQLQYFCAACNHGNMTKAARALHVSQPVVSVAIQELEAEFGVLLLHRGRRGFELTEDGRYLYARATQLLAQAEDLRQTLCDRGQQIKRVNLGIPPMIGAFLFPPLYRAFRAEQPDISLHSWEGGSHSLLQRLDSNELDFAILPINELSPATYQILPLTRTETVFCVSHESGRYSGVDRLALEQLRDEELVLFTDDFYQNTIIRERFAQAGIQPRIRHYSSQLYTIREFIVSGILSGFLFRDVAEEIPELRAISLAEPIEVEIGLVWKRGHKLLTDAMRFLRFVQRYAKGGRA